MTTIPSNFINGRQYEITYDTSHFTGTLKDVEIKENEICIHFMTENLLLVKNSGIWYIIKGSRRLPLTKFEIIRNEVAHKPTNIQSHLTIDTVCSICGKKYDSDDALKRHQSRSKICNGISKLPTIDLQDQLNKAGIKSIHIN